jgi:hypothetical protein
MSLPMPKSRYIHFASLVDVEIYESFRYYSGHIFGVCFLMSISEFCKLYGKW